MFNHYIGLDWSQSVTAISRRSPAGKEVQNFEGETNVPELKKYFKHLKGKIILTFEETTGAQWLYAELVDIVDELIVCDPYRNKLLSEGPKTDRIDASKLSKLLHAGMIKEVFHTNNEIIKLRKIVSGYEDLIKSGVRTKNQLSALSRGVNHTAFKETEQFVARTYEQQIEFYEAERKRYVDEFNRAAKRFKPIRDLNSIPGLGIVGAVKTLSVVVDVGRFSQAGNFLSYCGLVTHDRQSGGKSYGRKKPKYSRTLKNVFDVAAIAVINSKESTLRNYYTYLITEKNFAQHNARKALARRIARIAYGVLKREKRYDSEMIRK